ncbi:MAG: aminotransferase [Candidatus Buchananbacteria bacterium RBG_13_36_9]|uniref:alanine transaminase n=1 Tax=Candidatus Buchananbacteria bacterium RBG_13_36_9 TaxID=1797530 RepID=A0A1G1XNT9_9BACT|nr:MAG: aminotransferase [Candidatus Buchananbacteria bacterium RBG_13_36_9]
MPKLILKSKKFEGVLYDIRGPLLKEADRLEKEGKKIIRLNIGNTKPFGFDAPDEIITDVIAYIRDTEGYSDSRGIFSARKAIMQYYQTRKLTNLNMDHIFVNDGVSSAIWNSQNALLDNGDEILIPTPDYPLWTAAVKFAGGNPVHYICDEQSDWQPDLADLEKKITHKTRGIVIIPFNNPTGAVYHLDILKQLVRIAENHELIIFSDEIYDKIVYDGTESVSIASMSEDILFVTYDGLSKAYRLPGWRSGWMVLSGNTKIAEDYIEGINLLSNMRLCSNVVGQSAIQTALGGYQSIFDLTKEGGRLRVQRDTCYDILTGIDGITCIKPRSGLYLFPKMDTKKFGIESDEKFLLDFLREKHVLLVPGKGFNWPSPDHFRIVFLPHVDELKDALGRLKDFLEHYKQN